MEQKQCVVCNNSFTGDDNICDSCKNVQLDSNNKINRLASTIETLAVLKSYKELRKK